MGLRMADDPVAAHGDTADSKVFISYSRKDVSFIDRLETALVARGFRPLIDRAEIYAFEDWWKRIETLIVAADTVVFVLSPDAVASEICAKEIAFAASLNKKLAPIVCRRVADAAVPDALRRLNFIFFDDDAAFEASANRLAEALQNDIEWIRRHTQFGEVAHRWDAAGRPGPAGLMLRPPLLNEAEAWLTLRPRSAPEPTDTVKSFIAESRKAFDLEEARKAEQVMALRKATALSFLPNATDALAKGHHDHALRYIIAGAVLTDDPKLELVPEIRGLARPAIMGARNRLMIKPGGHIEEARFSPDGSLLFTIDVRDRRTAARTADIWSARTGEHLRAYAGGETSALAFSPAGDLLLLQERKQFRIINLGDQSIREFSLRIDEARFATFSSSGKRVALVDLYDCVIVNTRTGRRIATCRGHRSPITSVAFSADETRLVTTSGKDNDRSDMFDADCTTRVWNTATGEQVTAFSGHLTRTRAAKFCFGDKRILSCSSDRVALWDAESGSPTTQLEGGGLSNFGLDLSPDEKSAVSGDAIVIRDHRHGEPRFAAKVWNLKSGKMSRRLEGHTDNITVTAFSRDGSKIVTASRDGAAHVYEAENEQPIIRLGGFGHSVIEAEFSPDDRSVLTAGSDGTVRLWDIASGQPVAIAKLEEDEKLLAISPDGVWLFTDDDRKRRKKDKKSEKNKKKKDKPKDENLPLPASFRGFAGGPQRTAERATVSGSYRVDKNAAFSDCRNFAAIISGDEGPLVWNTKTRQLLGRTGGEAFRAAFKFSLNGTFLAVSHDDAETFQIWSVEPFKKIFACGKATMRASCFCFSSDNRFLAAISWDKVLRIWDLSTATELSSLAITGPREPDEEDEDEVELDPVSNSNPGADEFSRDFRSIELVVFSPDNNSVMFGSEGQAEIWNVELTRSLARLEFDSSLDSNVVGAFSPDGTKVLLSRGNGRIHQFRLVESGSAEPLTAQRSWNAHGNSVCAIAFSADGSRIVTASRRSTDNWEMGKKDVGIRVWDASTLDQLLSITQDNDSDAPQISADGDHAWTIEENAVKAWHLGDAAILTGPALIAPALARLDGNVGRLFEQDLSEPVMRMVPQDLAASAREQWPWLEDEIERARNAVAGVRAAAPE